MNDKIASMIAQYESDGDFTHVAPTPEMLEEAQMQLGVSIPQQFIDYLNTYSHGGIGFELSASALMEPWSSSRRHSSTVKTASLTTFSG